MSDIILKPRGWNPLFKLWSDHNGEYFGRFDGEWVDIRRTACRMYAWAVPSEHVIDKIAELGPLVEIGAGRGYWALLLASAGADIVCYEKYPPDQTHNYYFAGSADEAARIDDPGTYYPLNYGGADDAAKHPDRTLLLVWPCYAHPWAFETVQAYHKAGGKRVVFVGEGYGGCTADDAFFSYLNQFGREVDDFVLPVWRGIHDHVTVWELTKPPGKAVIMEMCSECFTLQPVLGFEEYMTWTRTRTKYMQQYYDTDDAQWTHTWKACASCFKAHIDQHLLPSGD